MTATPRGGDKTGDRGKQPLRWKAITSLILMFLLAAPGLAAAIAVLSVAGRLMCAPVLRCLLLRRELHSDWRWRFEQELQMYANNPWHAARDGERHDCQ